MANIGQHVVSHLRANPDKRFTARELAQQILQNHPEDFREKRESLARERPNVDFIGQLVAEIGARRPWLQRRYGELLVDESDHPKRYFWSVAGSATNQNFTEELIQKNALPQDREKTNNALGKISEVDIYDPFRKYLLNEKNILSLRIDERRSKNKEKGANHWLHPDIVALAPLDRHWTSEVVDNVRTFGSDRAELWPFEIKKDITASTLREYFFQAVSNSSWANYGYLVGTSLTGNADLESELVMLCSAYGIGYIHFNPNDHEKTNIKIPARKREKIDWNSANRIARENPDFAEYLRRVATYLKTQHFDLRGWGLEGKYFSDTDVNS